MFSNQDDLTHDSVRNESVVREYLSAIWNSESTGDLCFFLHPMFIDYSMPFATLRNINGVATYLHILKKHIHFSIHIDTMASCNDYVFVDQYLQVTSLCHEMPHASPTEFSRLFSIYKMQDHLIISHWQL